MTVALIALAVALALAVAWELGGTLTRRPRTPIPDVFRKAFE